MFSCAVDEPVCPQRLKTKTVDSPTAGSWEVVQLRVQVYGANWFSLQCLQWSETTTTFGWISRSWWRIVTASTPVSSDENIYGLPSWSVTNETRLQKIDDARMSVLTHVCSVNSCARRRHYPCHRLPWPEIKSSCLTELSAHTSAPPQGGSQTRAVLWVLPSYYMHVCLPGLVRFRYHYLRLKGLKLVMKTPSHVWRQ